MTRPLDPRLPPSLAGRRDTLAQLFATQLSQRLNVLIEASFNAGEDHVRRQWDQMIEALPAEARDAYAAGVWQALEVAQKVRDEGGPAQAVVDRIMAMRLFQAVGEVDQTSVGGKNAHSS